MELADDAQGGADASRSQGPGIAVREQCQRAAELFQLIGAEPGHGRIDGHIGFMDGHGLFFQDRRHSFCSVCFMLAGTDHHLGQGPVQVDRRRAGRIQVLADGFESCQKGRIPALLAQRPRRQDDGISRSDTDSRSPADGQDRNRLAHVLPRMAGQIDFFKRQLRLVQEEQRTCLPTQCIHYTVNPP